MRKDKCSIFRLSSVLLILLIILVGLVLWSLAIGSAGYSIPMIVESIFSKGENPVKTIVLSLRLPRVIVAIFIGIGLSMSGALLQAVMRNPLADPGTIGVSAGAATVATFVLLLFPTLVTSLPLFAFVGASLACVLIYAMAWKDGISPVRIILSGVAINSVLGGFTALLQILHSDNLSSVLGFLNGNLSGMGWSHTRVILIYSVIGIVLAFLCVRRANALQLGDEIAKNLGVNVDLSRILLSGVSAFIAASTVAVAGMIGFVGLVVPHIARMLVGSDYKNLLPTSMVLGSVVVLFADTLGRIVVPGTEIPLGIIMAVSGGPFFLYMLRKKGRISGN